MAIQRIQEVIEKILNRTEAVKGRGEEATKQAMVLPFIEQTALYDQMETSTNGFAIPWNKQSDLTTNGLPATFDPQPHPSETPLAVYMCPSDPRDWRCADFWTQWIVHETRGTIFIGKSNYVAVREGRRFDVSANSNIPDILDGIMTVRTGAGWHSFRDITDGTSNTFAIAERDTISAGLALNGTPQLHDGSIWAGAFANANMRCNTTLLANCQPWRGQFGVRTPWYLVNGLGAESPASQHPGGCQFAFGDGSVRFVQETMDEFLQIALASCQYGEVIPDNY